MLSSRAMQTITLELGDGDILVESSIDDTALLVESCLTELRVVAGLGADQAPVRLPPPPPPLAPRRKRVVLGKDAVKKRTATHRIDVEPEIPIVFEDVPPKPKRRTRAPVLLCAFVAIAAATAALVSSPLAARPEVRGVEASITNAVRASLGTLL